MSHHLSRAAYGLAGCFALVGCDFAAPPPPRAEERPSALVAPLQAENADAAGLYRVVETYFNDYLALNPVLATELGDHRFDDRFGDYASASWMADSLGIEQEALERLAAVNPQRLRGEDLVTYEAFKRERELAVYGFRYPSELLAIDAVVQWGNVFARLASGRGAHPFRTTQDYDHFLARMDGFAAWVDLAINNLRAGPAKGVVLPKAVVERVLPQLEEFARIEDPRQSVFWRPLLEFPPAPTVADRRRLITAYDEKLRTRVIPAYRRLHDYLASEYLPQARDTIAWSNLPGGGYWYAWLVRRHTTLDLTPDQVHELGLREVARLRADLAQLQPALGIAGDLQALLDAMRVDPKLRAASPAALLADYETLRARVEPNLPASFARRPRARLVIRAVESYRAAAAPLAGYEAPAADGARPAVLYVNAQDPASRLSYLVAPLFLHEALPGRHYLTALAQETPDLPSFRRFGRVHAFDEGWALYAGSLGPSLGLQADAYVQFGAGSMQLWRAAQLVVDTGIHARGWRRDRAIDYLRANSALGEAAIAAEVDRCIARPGEALAGKVGELRILELRREAQRRLGADFDLREFHEQVAGAGALPLPTLEAKVRRWIARRRG